MQTHRALHEALVVRLDRRLRALAAHRPAAVSLNFSRPEPRERRRRLEHLVLKDDRPERLAQRRLQLWVLVGNLEIGVDPQPLAPAARCRGRRRCPESCRARTIATWIAMSFRFSGRVRSSDCISVRLSIWETPVASASRIASYVGRILVRDAAEVDALPARARDHLDATLDRGQHPEPGRSIFRKPASAHESGSQWVMQRAPPSPHGGRGPQSISGCVATIIPPGCCDRWRGSRLRLCAPEKRKCPAATQGRASAGRFDRSRPTLMRTTPLAAARDPLDLTRGQPQHLPKLADCGPVPW